MTRCPFWLSTPAMMTLSICQGCSSIDIAVGLGAASAEEWTGRDRIPEK